jgi:hypothetical protein
LRSGTPSLWATKRVHDPPPPVHCLDRIEPLFSFFPILSFALRAELRYIRNPNCLLVTIPCPVVGQLQLFRKEKTLAPVAAKPATEQTAPASAEGVSPPAIMGALGRSTPPTLFFQDDGGKNEFVSNGSFASFHEAAPLVQPAAS